MSKFLSEKYLSLEPYVPGEQPKVRLVKLNTNENPYFPSKYAVEAIGEKELKDTRLYSDPDCAVLRQAIADAYGVKEENVFVSNGSDESLAFSFAAFCPKGAIFPDVTYGFYKVFASFFSVPFEEIPLKGDFAVDESDYMGRGETVFLANPNAQTGIYMPVEKIEKIVSSNRDRVVVVDEAYVDFGGESCVPLTKRYDNLLVVQTFSKSRSLAGARVGFAIGDRGLIEDLDRMKFSFNPYNVNRISQILAAEAVKDEEYFKECCDKVAATRERTKKALEDLGFEVLPSRSNFLLARCEISGGELQKRLRERGILVRHFDDERIRDWVRISMGSDEDMDKLLIALKEILT